MNRLNSLLTILISLLLGDFAGLAGGAYMHYRTFAALYVEQSAPWYFKLVAVLVGLLVLAILCMFLKILLRFQARYNIPTDDKQFYEFLLFVNFYH